MAGCIRICLRGCSRTGGNGNRICANSRSKCRSCSAGKCSLTGNTALKLPVITRFQKGDAGQLLVCCVSQGDQLLGFPVFQCAGNVSVRTEKTICHILQIKRRRSCRYHPEKIDIYLYKLSVGTRHEVVNKTVGKNRDLRFGGIFKRNQAHDLRSPFFLILLTALWNL